MDSAKAIFRNRCADDDGLASVAEMETGFNYGRTNRHHYGFVSRPLIRNPSFRNLSSPRSHGNIRSFFSTGRFFEEPHPSHFLDSCFLCSKTLATNKDIFMYRGDTPFCSEECRQEQIEMDEAKEKSRNLSASMRAMRKKEQTKSSPSSSTTSRDCASPSLLLAN